MEYRIEEPHGIGEIEVESSIRDPLRDSEWSKSFMVQLLQWSQCFDVLGIQPDCCTRDKGFGSWRLMAIGGDLILQLGNSNLFSAAIVKFRKLLQEIMSILITN